MLQTLFVLRSGTGLAALLLSAGYLLPAQAQELRLSLSQDSVSIGDRFYLSVAAEHEFAAEAVFPDPAFDESLVFGDLEVLRQRTRSSSHQDGVRIDSVVYEVTTFALDSAEVAPVRVLFTAGEDTFSVATEPTIIRVRSLVPPDAEDVRDLAPIVEFPRPILPLVLAGVAALLLLLAALYFWRRRKRRPAPFVPPEPLIPPDEEALQRLRALEQVDVSNREAIKPFYVELTDTLRRYVARRLGLHAMESTSRELVYDLRRDSRASSTTVDRLSEVLSLADLVKFADAEPDVHRSRKALETAREIVTEVEETLRPLAELELAAQSAGTS